MRNSYEVERKITYSKFSNIGIGPDWNLSNYPYMDIVLGDYCNSKCKFCVGHLVHKREILKIDDSFKKKLIFAYDKMGVREILLLGGEPTSLPNLFQALQSIKEVFGFNMYTGVESLNKICITTNGKMLKDRGYTKKLFSSGITHCNISFMSWSKSIRDTIGQSDTVLENTDLAVIKRIADDYGVHLRIQANSMLCNLRTARECIDYINFVSPYAHSVKISPLLKTDSFSTVSEVTEFNKKNCLPDAIYEDLFDSVVKHYSKDEIIIKNPLTFGFVKYVMIKRDIPIILNYNHRGMMMLKTTENKCINGVKLLPTGDLSLSWNRELNQYFINTEETHAI